MGCVCKNTGYVFNVSDVTKIDPAGLLPIKFKMIKEVEERFKFIQDIIIEAVGVRDVLELTNASNEGTALIANNAYTVAEAVDIIESRAFNFTTSQSKVQGFMNWLEDMEEASVLETFTRPGRVGGINQPWTNVYIESSYQKGLRRQYEEKVKQGIIEASTIDGSEDDIIRGLFQQPFHAERVGLLYQRTFSELKGVTKEMDRQISNVLSEGMVDGKNGNVIAKELSNRVNSIGIVRARAIARTEIQRAHHLATINGYEQAGIQGVVVLAEWTTGANPCPICASLSGEVFSLKQIRDMIPAHPNCVCVAIPYQPGIDGVKPSIKDTAGWLPNCSEIPHDILPIGLSKDMFINTAKQCLNPIDRTKVKRAVKKNKPVTEKDKKIIKKNEDRLIKSLKGKRSRLSDTPFDLYTGTKSKPVDMFQVQTISDSSKFVSWQKNLVNEKKLFVEGTDINTHSVAFKGKKIYYKKGLTNRATLSSMEEFDSITDLKKYLKTGTVPETKVVKKVKPKVTPKKEVDKISKPKIDEDVFTTSEIKRIEDTLSKIPNKYLEGIKEIEVSGTGHSYWKGVLSIDNIDMAQATDASFLRSIRHEVGHRVSSTLSNDKWLKAVETNIKSRTYANYLDKDLTLNALAEEKVAEVFRLFLEKDKYKAIFKDWNANDKLIDFRKRKIPNITKKVLQKDKKNKKIIYQE